MRLKGLLFACFAVLTVLAGCGTSRTEAALPSGNYDPSVTLHSAYYCTEQDGNTEPYLYLDTGDYSFQLGPGEAYSFADYGKFEIRDGKVIATSQYTASTYTFEVRDPETLVLTAVGEGADMQLPENTVFVYREDME